MERPIELATIEDAVSTIRDGGMAIVVDDPGRENEGDFLMAAELVTPAHVAFMVTHGRGLLCTPIPETRADALDLPLMGDGTTTAFTVSVDLTGGGTGISARERAACIRRLVDDDAVPDDFARPGHVFPLRARPGGVLERPGHTEAACELATLAGLRPGGMICEILNDDGTMARLPDLAGVAARFGLPLVTIEDLIAYRLRLEPVVRRTTSSAMPSAAGDGIAVCYETTDELHHLALVLGTPGPGAPVHVHVECLTGDLLGGWLCGCGDALAAAQRAIASAGAGVIVYLRRPSGAGHGLTDREAASAVQIVRDLGIDRPHLLCDDPIQRRRLVRFGLGTAPAAAASAAR